MELNPLDRRFKIYQLMEADTEFCLIKEVCAEAEAVFTGVTERFPEDIRNTLWNYPGMGYLLHSRMLTIICEHMKFEDEDEQPPQP